MPASSTSSCIRRSIPTAEKTVLAKGLPASPGRRFGRAGVRCRRGGASQGAGPHRDSRPRRDFARRRAGHACRARHSHHAGRHDEPCGRGGARHGEALRRRRLFGRDRPRARDAFRRRRASAQGRRGDHRRLDRPDHQGPRADARAGAVGRLQHPDAMGRRLPPAESARQCRHAGRCAPGAGLRRRRHRALPHRAHVLRGDPHPRHARDDPCRRSGGAAPCARQAPAGAAPGLRRAVRDHGRTAGDHSPARSAAA